MGRMGVLQAAQWVGDVMRAIPGPTPEWADLIGSLAWPGVILFAVTRYRNFLRSFLETVAARLRTDDVKLGAFEISATSRVVPLDPEEAAALATEDEQHDIERTEMLFELISGPAGFQRLRAWLNEALDETLTVAQFLSSPEYAIEREAAHRALIGNVER